jgi:hypothetical protein
MKRSIATDLLDSRDDVGAWGTYRDRPTNVEATSFAIMGLAAAAAAPDAVRSALDTLAGLQRPDGAWSMIEGGEPSPPATAVATIALSGFGGHRPQISRAAAWLVDQSGVGASLYWRFLHTFLPHRLAVESDPSLRGWPWTVGTWNWVEPTAYTTLALKRAMWAGASPAGTAARVEQAEQMLYDRMCRGGGWNFGNKNVLGEDLAPYPDTTAITLVALQDRRRQPGVVQSLRAFDRIHAGHDSGLVASLVAICDSLFGRDDSAARTQLAESYRSTGFVGDNKVRGLALLATGDHRRWLALG